jgi:F-type H+-transporting ATPase subunit delta
MLWIYLIVLQIVFFGGLLFFLRYVLTRNISKATGRLHELSKDYAEKEKEANQLLQNAQRDAKSLLAKETQAAQEAKETLIAEAQGQKEQILREANQKGAEIADKAQRNADFLRKELENKIDQRAKEMVNALIQKAVPQDFLENVHQQWVDEADKGVFNLKHLKLPEKANEAKIVSAFPLTDKQLTNLKEKLKKKIETDVALKVTVDPTLIAGFVISIGSVVVDASLKYKIQKAMQE